VFINVFRDVMLKAEVEEVERGYDTIYYGGLVVER